MDLGLIKVYQNAIFVEFTTDSFVSTVIAVGMRIGMGVVGYLGLKDLQFSYLSPSIQEVTLDSSVAQRVLGRYRAKMFQALVADLRSADFLGEMPSAPVLMTTKDGLLASFDIGDHTVLLVKPLDENWESAHRVLLRNINRDDEVVV